MALVYGQTRGSQFHIGANNKNLQQIIRSFKMKFDKDWQGLSDEDIVETLSTILFATPFSLETGQRMSADFGDILLLGYFASSERVREIIRSDAFLDKVVERSVEDMRALAKSVEELGAELPYVDYPFAYPDKLMYDDVFLQPITEKLVEIAGDDPEISSYVVNFQNALEEHQQSIRYFKQIAAGKGSEYQWNLTFYYGKRGQDFLGYIYLPRASTDFIPMGKFIATVKDQGVRVRVYLRIGIDGVLKLGERFTPAQYASRTEFIEAVLEKLGSKLEVFMPDMRFAVDNEIE